MSSCTPRVPMFHPHPAYRGQHGAPYQYYGTQNLLDPNMAYCKYQHYSTSVFHFICYIFLAFMLCYAMLCYDCFLPLSRWTVTCSCCWSSHDVLELSTRGTRSPSVRSSQLSEPRERKQLPRTHSVNIPFFLLLMHENHRERCFHTRSKPGKIQSTDSTPMLLVVMSSLLLRLSL